MITNILMSLSIVAFAFATALSTVDSMHFFQLNSYRFDTHTKWMRENSRRFLAHSTFSVLMLICLFLEISINIKAGVLVALFALACIWEKPKKAKKPLVYTPRVKRMLVTIIVVSTVALLATCACMLKNHHESVILLVATLIYALAPVLVLLANLAHQKAPPFFQELE